MTLDAALWVAGSLPVHLATFTNVGGVTCYEAAGTCITLSAIAAAVVAIALLGTTLTFLTLWFRIRMRGGETRGNEVTASLNYEVIQSELVSTKETLAKFQVDLTRRETEIADLRTYATGLQRDAARLRIDAEASATRRAHAELAANQSHRELLETREAYQKLVAEVAGACERRHSSASSTSPIDQVRALDRQLARLEDDVILSTRELESSIGELREVNILFPAYSPGGPGPNQLKSSIAAIASEFRRMATGAPRPIQWPVEPLSSVAIRFFEFHTRGGYDRATALRGEVAAWRTRVAAYESDAGKLVTPYVELAELLLRRAKESQDAHGIESVEATLRGLMRVENRALRLLTGVRPHLSKALIDARGLAEAAIRSPASPAEFQKAHEQLLMIGHDEFFQPWLEHVLEESQAGGGRSRAAGSVAAISIRLMNLQEVKKQWADIRY